MRDDNKPTTEQIEGILRLHLSRVPSSIIARRVQVPRREVNRVIREMGVRQK